MPTVDTGAYAVFQYSSALNVTQVDAAFAGQIPTTTNSTGAGWTRLYTSFDKSASVEVAGSVVDLKTQENGLLKVVVNDVDKWMIKSGIADMTLNTYKTLLQLAPNYFSSSGVVMPLNSNIVGTDLLSNGLPILVIHKSYQNASTGTINTPALTDPLTFFFCKAGIGERNFSVGYDPKAQQVIDFSLTAINCTGTSQTNVLGCIGTVTAATSS